MKIAIVKLSALGDIIHAMIVLQFIKSHYKEIEVDWIVEESYKDLLESNPDINSVHVVNIKKAKEKKSIYFLFNELRKLRKFGKYDLVIDMQGLIKSALISRLMLSPITLGFDRFSIRESIATIFYNKTFKYRYDENVILRNFELIKFALDLPLNKEEIHCKLPFLFPSQNYVISGLSSIKKNIILIPGSSHKSKRYPIEKFAKTASNINANFLIIWGNEKEKIMANEIKALSNKVYVCEKLSLNQLISLISQVDLVIGADTGPTHMAWALNIPSITLLGSTPGYRNTFSTNINKSIESNSKVNPYKINKNDHSINEISVNKLNKLANELLRINI
jgi:heptosyltransferase I